MLFCDGYNGASRGGNGAVACPFFLPTEKFVEGGWNHRSRLPLGDGWRGRCTSGGLPGVIPSDQQLQEFCNLGYALRCPYLPQPRHADAMRFGVIGDRDNTILICYVSQINHRPAGHGTLEYDCGLGQWRTSHSDSRIQAMAACYLDTYLQRRAAPCGSAPTELMSHGTF